MADWCERIEGITSRLPEGVTLVAVTKTHPVETCAGTVACGHLDLGENRVQELVEKAEALGPEVRWHQIGHLQTNKVKYIAPFVHLIHAVDSERLLAEIDKQAARHDRVQDVLLQVHIAQEEHKFGWAPDALLPALDSGMLSSFPHLRVRGLMGMATFTDDRAQVAREFTGLRALYDGGDAAWDTLSMGMSGDWELAVEAGSTMIRVGSTIYGARG